MIACRTAGELIAALQQFPQDAKLATLYDWGGDVKYGVSVRGIHDGQDDEEHLGGYLMLDIDPPPGQL